MKFTPRPWQIPMHHHIMQVDRNCLFAGMGLGKTTSAANAIHSLHLLGDLTRPVLVLAPKRVAVSTWPDEIAKWDHLGHLDVTPIVGDAKTRKAVLSAAVKKGNTSIFTMNYENLTWLEQTISEEGFAWPFEMVIADESTRLKNLRISNQVSKKGKEFTRGQGGSIRARSIARVAHKHVNRWCNMTGTPSPNGLKDLWGQLWLVDGGQRLGRTYTAFEQRWFKTSYDGYGVEPLPFAQEQIQDAIRDVCLSLNIRGYVDIAEPIMNTVYVDLPVKARQIYNKMEKEMFAVIGGHEVEAFNKAGKTCKCLQLASGAVYVDPDVESDESPRSKAWVEIHDAKIQALESLLVEAAGAPVLVAYHFKSDLARLRKAFPKGRYLDDDPKTQREWNAGKIPLLFAHPESAGHGLNLQVGGNILVFFSHWWKLEAYQQIIERIGPTRQMQAGLDRPVFIHHIVARDTVDEDVVANRNSKKEVQEILMEAMKRRQR